MLKIIKIILFLIFLAGFAYGQLNLDGTRPILNVEGKAGEALGKGAVGLGDINGDKYPDFAVGAYGINKLFIYFGGPGILDGIPDIKLEGGKDVFWGDINGDGIKDIISQKSGGEGTIDTFFIYPGKKSNSLCIDTIPEIILTGKSGDYLFGQYTAFGDINGDSINDLITACPHYWNQVTGKRGTIIYIWLGKKKITKEPDLYFLLEQSKHVANQNISISDVNGDGIGDLIFGYDYQDYSVDPFIIYSCIDIYYGKKDFSFDQYHPDQHLDSRIMNMNYWNFYTASFIDLNNDGFNDMLCERNKDTLCVFYGSRDTFKLKEDMILKNYDPGSVTLLPNVFKIGDLNHDGWKEYAVRCWSTGHVPGLIIYLGCPKGISRNPVAVCYKACDNGEWGRWVSDLGDINNDGYDEFITTSPHDCWSFDPDIQWGYFSIIGGWNNWKVDVKNKEESPPENFDIKQNYPNPFNSATVISYQLPVRRGGSVISKIKIIIYNLLGSEIIKLIDEEKLPGNYSITWDGKDSNGIGMPSGTYFYKLFVNNQMSVNKMILLR
jgi:hypothetical protein